VAVRRSAFAVPPPAFASGAVWVAELPLFTAHS
jgi:hypothetical protein